jgi:uncharacterized repeat protein (TIGR01451 family)
MSNRYKAIALLLLLTLVYLVGPSLGAPVPSALTVNQLVTSEQTVSLQAPSGDYLYQWTAESGGSTIGAGTAQKFSFRSPKVSQDEGSKTVTISLFIRSIEGGCVNQTTTNIQVYSLPVCGINGPAQVGPYDTATYTYTGGTSGTLTFEWNIDGTKIDGTSSSVNIDWTKYSPANHTVGMTLTKDYSSVAPGSTNPFRTITCAQQTNITYTSGLEVTKVPSKTTAAVGETITYTYTIRNTGTIGLVSLALLDDKLGAVTLNTTTLMPGISATATKTYAVKETDLPGPINNTVTASGAEDRTKKPVSAKATATVALTYNAALSLTKVPSSTTAKVGETVTYQYTIKNTGNVTIKGLNLTDDKLGSVKTDKNVLAAGETATASATHKVVETDLPGPLTNIATVQGTNILNKAVTTTATATVTLTYTSSLIVTKTPSSDTAKVGDILTYRFTVKNNGSVTVNGLALVDDKLGAITLDKNTLAAGETAIGSATHKVVETDLPGPLTNVATATATDSQSKAVTATATASVPLTYTATLQVTKTPSASTANVGETVTYQFVVKNTGTVTLNGLAMTDDKLGSITLDKSSLAAGETANGTATHTVVETDLPGPLTNVATATATDSQNKPVTSQATASIRLTYTAAMQVTKTPSSTTAKIGDTITYQFAVKNSGNVTLNALTLTDDKLGVVTLDTATLAAGATATGSLTHTVVETDLPGPLTNIATAKATDSQGKAVTSQAKAAVELTYTATMSVTKTPSTPSAKVGDTVTYTYTVRNTGTVTIKGLKLSDDKLKEIVMDRNTLAPGEAANGTATHTVVETDLPGPLTNIVTATATDTIGKAMTAEARATVELTYAASMVVTKTPSSTTAKVGETITYAYTIRNTGTVSIKELTLKDDKLGDITISKNSLAANETVTGSSTHKVVEGDLPGPLTNIVTASGNDVLNKPVTPATATATVTLNYAAALNLTKTASTNSAGVGTSVTYSFSIKNTGDVTINAVTVVDNKLGAITPAKTTLAPGETTTGTATYVLKETDLPGPLTNIATASGTDSQNKPVTPATAQATVRLTYTATLSVTKVSSVRSAGVGQTVTYNYTVKNTGTVTINAIALSDDKLGLVTPAKTTLATGESTTGSVSYAIKESDLPGPLTNIVTVSGNDILRKPVAPVTATATVTLTYTSSLSITKTASSKSPLWIAGMGAKLGDDIVYTYVVSNTGTTTVSLIAAADDKLGAVTFDRNTLAPGERATGSLTHKVVQDDLGEELKATIVNTVAATGTSIGKQIKSDPATVTAGVYRDAITPVISCVSDNGDGTYTAFFGYSNTNNVAVTLSIGKKNRFTPSPDGQGQPTTFEPGEQKAVFGAAFKGDSLVWNLDDKTGEATPKSGGCSQAGCGLDGPADLCKNKVETYTYTPKEDTTFTQTYAWSMDNQSMGTGKSIEISGSKFEIGGHKLTAKIIRLYKEMTWSNSECSMEVKVIPEPSAEISMQEES